MNIVFIFSLILTVIYNFFVAEKIICKPPNKFVQIFCPPGVGKTTLAAKIVKDNLNLTDDGQERIQKKVYSNVPIVGANIYDLKDLGKFQIENCILIIDEAGSKVGNRNWHTNLNDDQIEFLKLHRHYNVDIYLFSQSYGDVDNKFRELTTELYMLKKSFIPFRINAKAIDKKMDLINGQIVEFFEWNKVNSFHFFNVDKWGYFNSYQTKQQLPLMYNKKYTKIQTVDSF